MDFKVSRRERRRYQESSTEVLVNNTCDLYPIYGDDPRYAELEIYSSKGKVLTQDRKNYIMDVEILNDDRAELLDRAMFALMKQRGGDPTELDDGIQWAEAVLGEVPPPVILQQVHSSVSEEGPGVWVVAGVIKSGNKEQLVFKVELTNAI